MSKKVILFGGTFDPPHLGHTKMVSAILDQGIGDEVWYLPVHQHQDRFSKDSMSSWEDRVAMLNIILEPKTKISMFEKTSGQKSFTHLALRSLTQQYPDYTFSWLMGSDQLPTLHLWKCNIDDHCFPEAADEFDYFVYPRLGFPMELPYSNLKEVKNVEPMAISSTVIRQRVQAGESITGLVDPKVEEHIFSNQLYRR